MNEIPSRCIDPVMKYCQGCRYGHCIFPEWVETYEDYQAAASIQYAYSVMIKADPKTSPQTKN